MSEHTNRIATEVRRLMVHLEDGDLRVAGDNLAVLIQQRAELEDAHAESRKAMKAEAEKLDQRIGHLAGVITARREERDVEVDVLGDFVRGIAEEVRRDTGELLGTRALRHDEWQMALPKVEEVKAPPLEGPGPENPPTTDAGS